MVTDFLQSLSAEERLLLSLCRLDFSEGQKEEITSLMKKVGDWNRFIHLANEHGIIALCWYNITETGNAGYIPLPHLNRLHTAYLKSFTRNTWLSGYLEEIVSIAEEEKIKIVLLKGLALEKTIYGDKGLRQMSDIDILVKQDQVYQLRDALIKNGYSSESLKSPLYRHILFYIGKHIPSLHKNDCSVDMHFRLFNQKRNSLTEKFIETSLPITLKDKEVFVPPSQLNFLYLIRHLCLHEASGTAVLRSFTDLNILLDSCYDKIINREITGLAVEAGLEQQLSDKIYILNLFFGVPCPDWLTDYISRVDHTRATGKFLENLINPGVSQVENQDPDYINLVRSIPGFFNKVLYVTGFMFPSFKFIKNRYKVKTIYGAILFYPVRWTKVCKTLIKAAVIRKDNKKYDY